MSGCDCGALVNVAIPFVLAVTSRDRMMIA